MKRLAFAWLVCVGVVFSCFGSAGAIEEVLVCHFPFNGNADDESGNGHDGTVNGATLTTDRFGVVDSAYLFDGVNDYIEVPDSTDLRLSQTDFTISTWFNEASRTPSAPKTLIAKRLGPNQMGWHCVTFDGKSQYQVSGAYDPRAVSTGLVSINTWNHFVVTYDLATTTIRLYINGVLDSVHANIPPPNAATTASMMIGRDSEMNRYLFHGAIDDIQIYSRILSTEEVSALYRNDSLLSISIPEDATEGDGILSLAGTVNIATAPSSNLVINLYSSDSGELGVADTVTILTGQTNATFDLVIYDDALLDGSQTAMITASAANHRDSSAEIVVHDNETATLTLSLPQTTLEGEGTIAGALIVDPVPDEDITVELISNNSSKIAGRSIVIPAGQSLVSFTLDVIDDNLIDGMQTATIVAQVQNWVGSQASVFIFDNESTVLGIQVPDSAMEGDGVLTNAGTVSLSGVATSDIHVILASSDTTEAVVPAYVTISNGQSSASFDIAVLDDADGDTDGVQLLTMLAQSPGFLPASDMMEVQDNNLYSFAIDGLATNQPILEPAAVNITAMNIDGMPMTWFAGSVALAASGDIGAVELSPSSATNFAAGTWSGDIVFNNIANNVILTADDGARHSGTSRIFNVLGSQIIITPDSLSNTFVVAGETLVRTMVISNAGNTDLEFMIRGGGNDAPQSSNLILNGNFEGGNTGFSTGYTYLEHTTPPWPVSGEYGVGDDPKIWHGGLYTLDDHTSGSGNMWMANGDTVPNTLWEQSVDVVAGETYNFSAWAAILYTDNAQLGFFVDGESVGTLDVIQVGWVQFSGQWTSKSSSSVVLSIRNLSYGGTEAYAIDDLEFKSSSLGLITHFPFNGNAVDESGNGHDGTVNGATLTTDRFGNADSAYMFDGINDFIEVPDHVDLRLSQTDFTISTWFNEASRTPSATKTLIAKRLGPNQKGWHCVTFDGKSQYQVSGGYDPRAVSTGLVSINTWNHFVVTYDLATTTIRLYINGVLDSVHANIPSANASTTANMIIGQDSEMSRYLFHGAIDDIQIYNRMLSTDEVFALYLEDDGSGNSWLSLSPETGTVPPGSNAMVEVQFDASGFEVGDYSNAVLSITCNDAFSPSNSVPVSMWVVPAAPTMVAEPEFTLGTSNGVAWTMVDGPVSYLTEVVADTNSAPLQQSGWMASTNHTFYSLTTNVVYYYHVKASVSSGIGLLEGAWSDWVQSEQVADLSDFDGDGLPNWWEQLYFDGTRSGQPLIDTDGDGQINRDEFIAGMDPTDPYSSFMVRTFDTPTNGMVVLSWDSVTGRVYSVSWSTNMPSSFQTLETEIRHPQNSYTDSVHNAESQGFYQIGVELE